MSTDEKESGEVNPLREVGVLQTLSAMSKQWEKTLFELANLRSKLAEYEEDNKRLRAEVKTLKHTLHAGVGKGGGVRFARDVHRLPVVALTPSFSCSRIRPFLQYHVSLTDPCFS